MAGKNQLPHALSGNRLRRKPKVSERRRELARKIQSYRKGMLIGERPQFTRHRGIMEIQKLFSKAGLPTVEQAIQQKVHESGRCNIFEIGSGYDFLGMHIQQNIHLSEIRDKITIKGMDILNYRSDNKDRIIGDALSKPFPKSDIIVSQWALGYIGQFGFMLKKTAEALNPKGVAVLHINFYGVNVQSNSNRPQKIVKSPRQVRKSLEKIRIPRCTVEVKSLRFWGVWPLLGAIVVIKKS